METFYNEAIGFGEPEMYMCVDTLAIQELTFFNNFVSVETLTH